MRRCKCEKRPFDILQGMLEGDKMNLKMQTPTPLHIYPTVSS